MGGRVIGISGSLIWSKPLRELIFNPCGEFRWSLEGPVSQIHSPHLHFGDPGIFSDLLRSVQMLKREWGAETNGKLPHIFTLVKLSLGSWVCSGSPAFGQNYNFGSCVCNERPALGQITLMMSTSHACTRTQKYVHMILVLDCTHVMRLREMKLKAIGSKSQSFHLAIAV